MKNPIYTILALLIAAFEAGSQDLLFEKNMGADFNNSKESFAAANEANGDLAVFLLDNKTVTALLLNEKFELLDSFFSPRSNSAFKKYLGYTIDENAYHLYYTYEFQNQFLIRSINFKTKSSSEKITEIRLTDEKFIESFNYKNKYYLLSILKKSSKVKLYIFEGDRLTKTQEVDIPDYSITGTSTLYKDLNKSSGVFQSELDIHKINNAYYNPLNITSKAYKIYSFNDKIYLTIDNELDYTKLISIDLNDFTGKVKLYKQYKIRCSDIFNVKSNSYLYNNLLYQITGCKDELYFSAYNLASDSLIKDFKINKDDKIAFKNTPIIQEGGMSIFSSDSEKELEKNKDAFKKICFSDIGITAYLVEDTLRITVGGYQELRGGGGVGGMMMPGATISTPGGGSISTGPTFSPGGSGFNSENSRTVYFTSLFDKSSFNHLPGIVSQGPLDKIHSYSNKKPDFTSETIFKLKDFYVFGYYNKKEKKYYLRKFVD